MAAATEPKGIEIKLAFLHQAVNVPGMMSMERTLSEQKVPGVKMTWTPMGLVLEGKGKKAIIPAANVAVAILAD